MPVIIKWWFVFCISIAIVVISYLFGIIAEINAKDVTKLSFVIIALYFVETVYLGKLAIKKKNKEDIENGLNTGWFISETLLALGMIGTVAGFILMLGGSFVHLDVSNTESLRDALTAMALGMSTALYTTLVGLIFSQLLKVQLINLETKD